MRTDWSIFVVWLGLFFVGILGIFLDYKLWHIPPNIQKKVTKSIVYSFLVGFGIILIPIFAEIIFPFSENCSATEKSFILSCEGTYINWRFIGTILILSYFAIVSLIWEIWDLLHGELDSLKFSLKLKRGLRCAIGLLGIIMMLPLAWLRNFLLGI